MDVDSSPGFSAVESPKEQVADLLKALRDFISEIPRAAGKTRCRFFLFGASLRNESKWPKTYTCLFLVDFAWGTFWYLFG